MPGADLRAELLSDAEATDIVRTSLSPASLATGFQRPEWLRALARGFGVAGYWLLWRRGEEVCGVLPATQSLKRRRPRLVSLPFSYPVEPVWLSSVPENGWKVGWRAVQEAGFTAWVVKGVASGGTPYELPYRRSVVTLDRPIEELRAAYKSNTRTAVRHAERAGVTVREWTAADRPVLRTFLRTHHRRLAIPELPEPWIAALESLIESGVLECRFARHEDRALAVTIDVPGRTTVGAFACSVDDPELLRLRPNDILRDASIAAAVERGAEVFDLGASHVSADGQLRHKRGFGAVEEPVHYTLFGMKSPAMRQDTAGGPSSRVLRACPSAFYPALSRLLIRSADW